jgi:nucleotide-binding universal stress UspA family protein
LDGSELAGNAVHYGIALAKEIGAKVTVLTVSVPFHVFTFETEMVQETPAEYKKRAKERATRTLGAAANTAETAGVMCGNGSCRARTSLPSHHRHGPIEGL